MTLGPRRRNGPRAPVRVRPSYVGAVAAGLAVSLLAVASTTATQAARTACSPSATILKSPRPGSKEVQAKAINDRGDIVGFADSRNGSSPVDAILWKGGKVAGAVDLGVLPGYVSSEAYGVNNNRVVFGLLYDKKERTFPFRWEDGRMTVLKGPNGRIQQASGNPGSDGRNAINDRGEMAWTLIVGGNPRAVRWRPDGKATLLPRLPGHAWSWAFGINRDGVVSGWSRKQPNEDGEENPVIWPKSGEVVPMKTAPGRADGIAEATNRAGLTVGYLGNLGTDKDPESDQAAVWATRTAEPRLLGPVRPNFITELVDVNDRGQAAGMSGTLNPKNGFTVPEPVIWQTGWAGLHTIRVPAASRVNSVVVTNLNDINNRGAIVGNVYGLAGKDYSKLRRIDPVLWTCAFGR
jgi:probable HAF family extracellular repeat protein